jgi:peptide/nickel transport system substrate-binding protein
VWHDGEPFDADDVVFSIQAYQNPKTASSEAGRVAWIDSVTAMSPHQLMITFNNPEYAPQDKLHFKILPAHRFSGTAVARSDPFRTTPVGTGPWKVASFNDDNSVTLAHAERSWRETQLPEFKMREVSDKNYQAKLLLYESLEALVQVLPRDLATLQNDRKVELYPYQTNSWWYFGFNTRDSRLKDARVREALSLMVSVEELLAPIGTGDLVSGPFVTSSPFYNHEVAPPGHDPDRGAELLTEAGYSFNGRSWVGADGKELKLRLATQSNLETAQDVVINLQSQLQARGITVEPEFLGVAEWKQRVWRDHDFDIMLSLWSFDRNEDVREQFHSSGSRNFCGYRSSKVDKLLDQARFAADPQEKKSLLRQAHAAIAGDHPMIFLWTLDSYSALSTRVDNVVVHPFYFFTWASDWSM